MELWNHCENPYPFVPAEVLDAAPSVRASLPNKYCEPEIAARLYDEVFEEYQHCDDIGLHIVTNEHHSGINNLWAASPVITGIVARLTKKVRILSLGTLITVRPDPVRFQAFNDYLRLSMRQETALFFQNLLTTDGSILDFLDSKYSFLNEELAQYYGIPGVK